MKEIYANPIWKLRTNRNILSFWLKKYRNKEVEDFQGWPQYPYVLVAHCVGPCHGPGWQSPACHQVDLISIPIQSVMDFGAKIYAGTASLQDREAGHVQYM